MYDMGEHSYKAPAATMPYAAHFMEQNALTDNKQKITKQISRSKKKSFTSLVTYRAAHSLLLIPEGSPPPTSLPEEAGIAQPSPAQITEHSRGQRLSRREIQRWESQCFSLLRKKVTTQAHRLPDLLDLLFKSGTVWLSFF